ncbi:hypothetical protein FSP39_001774 [Pinctada imbricata]|uniref:HAT C-terminal dimerisation domain-containing protein n=1 Tax=Pinctada imbricata TaxID=66713 RepID=A0AA88Y9W2_PINIB|nr:hypothetical protein FSP39_001774 [Pinctada imbricata]
MATSGKRARTEIDCLDSIRIPDTLRLKIADSLECLCSANPFKNVLLIPLKIKNSNAADSESGFFFSNAYCEVTDECTGFLIADVFRRGLDIILDYIHDHKFPEKRQEKIVFMRLLDFLNAGLGTDGATVMTGRKEGLTGHFLRENSHLVNTHCSAHKIALCSEQAAENIPAMKYYQQIVESLFYYFKKSPKRNEEVSAVQTLLDEPSLRYREVHQVRWLSFYQALDAIYRTLDSMISYFSSKQKIQKLKKTVKVQGYPINSTSQIWGLINQYHKDDFPNLIKLAHLALTHPVHISDCERAFSAQNHITTPLRNRISGPHCDQLMRVMIEGPNSSDFSFKSAFKEWKKKKSRAILTFK